ncbi:hypothetical protein EK21DRAFT_95677 [Setomelanomma holmii]|uniref:Uncharacterized protein n=1 Tax=Setomelanomma holmii TaxID=210430 RepID=A0A9P4GV00_9PLEO|nr:hypothetical protein EK21DRAFT_95677 [Setomelanomma holmii]
MADASPISYPLGGYCPTGGVLTYVDDGQAAVTLIETTSDGISRRLKVTEELLETYIEKGYGRETHRNDPIQALSVPAEETVKFFWSRRIGRYNGDMIPLHISKDLYARLAPYARIPSVLPQSLINKTAVHIRTIPQLPESFFKLSRKQVREQHLSFILQSIPGAMNHVYAGASFTGIKAPVLSASILETDPS